MTFSKKSYKTHQLLIKKHPGIPQLNFEPIKDFDQGSKMTSSNVIMLIHSNVSKFHEITWSYPRNEEEGLLPSPSEPQKSLSQQLKTMRSTKWSSSYPQRYREIFQEMIPSQMALVHYDLAS